MHIWFTQSVDYTLEVVKDVVLAGISDPEIRTSVQEDEGIEAKTLNETVSLIERKEKARKAYGVACSGVDVSTLSTFKRQQSINSDSSLHRTPPPQSPKIACPQCQKPFCKFNGRNTKAFQVCLNCYRASRNKRGTREHNAVAFDTQGTEEPVLMQSLSINSTTVNSGEASQAARDHPRTSVRIRHAGKDKVAEIVVVADTGAQSNIWNLKDYLKAGFKVEDLTAATLGICAANKQRLDIKGKFLAEIEGDSPNGKKTTKNYLEKNAVLMTQYTMILT